MLFRTKEILDPRSLIGSNYPSAWETEDKFKDPASSQTDQYST